MGGSGGGDCIGWALQGARMALFLVLSLSLSHPLAATLYVRMMYVHVILCGVGGCGGLLQFDVAVVLPLSIYL